MAELKFLQPLARWLGRQRWIRFGIRDRFARLVENPDRTRGHPFCQPFFGGVYEGNTGNFIDWSSRYFGAYAREELDLFVDLYSQPLLDRGAVIDVGANVGNHSLFYALQGAQVLSFEPNPAAMALLKRKLAANAQLNLHPIEMGLSSRAERLALWLPDHANLGTASLEKAVGSVSVNVDVDCGDQIEQIQRLKHIGWIKIDVEGHELAALLGLQQTIAKHRPPVFFEWNGGGDFSQLLSLFPEGYSFHRFVGDQNVMKIFGRPGYRLQPLTIGIEPALSNVLAWPSKQLPRDLSHRLCP
jgi:FkbM family methyltransferase